MATKTTGKKGMSTGAMIGVGVAVAAAAASAYLLFGPEGKKNRKAVKGWAVKMKGEIIEKFEKVKDLTEPMYQGIIDEVQSKYSKMKNIDPKELQSTVREMRSHWKAVSKTTKPKAKAMGKKMVKKAVKKVKAKAKK